VTLVDDYRVLDAHLLTTYQPVADTAAPRVSATAHPTVLHITGNTEAHTHENGKEEGLRLVHEVHFPREKVQRHMHVHVNVHIYTHIIFCETLSYR